MADILIYVASNLHSADTRIGKREYSQIWLQTK